MHSKELKIGLGLGNSETVGKGTEETSCNSQEEI